MNGETLPQILGEETENLKIRGCRKEQLKREKEINSMEWIDREELTN